MDSSHARSARSESERLNIAHEKAVIDNELKKAEAQAEKNRLAYPKSRAPTGDKVKAAILDLNKN